MIELIDSDKQFKSSKQAALVGGGWETLAAYDKAGPELDLLNKARDAVKNVHATQAIVSKWYIESRAQIVGQLR